MKTALFTQAPTGDLVDAFGLDIAEAVIPSLIVAWLNENLADFAHVFAVVDLNEYIDKDEAWAWTKPTYIDYAYSDGPTAAESILGVLCMTGGRTGTVQQLQMVDPSAIPGGSIAGYLISEERLLVDLMLPTLPMKWTHSTQADYEVVVSGDTSTGKYQHVLQLKSGHSIKLDPVEHYGSQYTPYCQRYSGRELQKSAVQTSRSDRPRMTWLPIMIRYLLRIPDAKSFSTTDNLDPLIM